MSKYFRKKKLVLEAKSWLSKLSLSLKVLLILLFNMFLPGLVCMFGCMFVCLYVCLIGVVYASMFVIVSICVLFVYSSNYFPHLRVIDASVHLFALFTNPFIILSHPSICPSIHASVHPSVHPSIHPSILLSLFFPAFYSFRPWHSVPSVIWWRLHPFAHISFLPSIPPSICQSIHPLMGLFIPLSILSSTNNFVMTIVELDLALINDRPIMTQTREWRHKVLPWLAAFIGQL